MFSLPPIVQKATVMGAAMLHWLYQLEPESVRWRCIIELNCEPGSAFNYDNLTLF